MKATFALTEKEDFVGEQWEWERQVEKGHGRLEIRDHWTLRDPAILAYLDPEGKRKGLQGIGCSIFRFGKMNRAFVKVTPTKISQCYAISV